jgi:hypothetical protein
VIRYRRGMLNPEQQKVFASLTCCQKIPREGQEQIVRLLAERLDLEVVPVGHSEEGAKTFLALEALVSHLHFLPTGLGDFLGEDLYEQVMRALGRDDVLAERDEA